MGRCFGLLLRLIGGYAPTGGGDEDLMLCHASWTTFPYTQRPGRSRRQMFNYDKSVASKMASLQIYYSLIFK